MLETTLVFDIDNTLLNRDRAFRYYISDFISRYEYCFEGICKNAAIKKLISMDCRGLKKREIFCKELLAEYPKIPLTPDEIWEDHRSLPEFITPDPELIALIKQLAYDYNLIVLSNGSSYMQRRKLEKLGITDLFSEIFISGEMNMSKPDKNIFKEMIKTTGPGIHIMIGDDYDKDIVPASQLKFKTVHITNDRPKKIAADAVISEIYDLKEVLQWLI